MADRLIQLATNLEKLSLKAKISAFAEGGWMSEKLDGVFMFAVCNNGVIKFYSSTGEEYISFNGTDVEMAIRKLHIKTWTSFVLLGEAYHPALEQSGISGLARTETEGAAQELEYHVHDILTLSEYAAGNSTKPYNLRKKILEDMFGASRHVYSKLFLLEQIPCESVEHFIEYTKGLQRIRKSEGGCFKPTYAGWEAGNRGTNLVRIKELITRDLEVSRVGEVEEGPKGGLLGVIYVWFKPYEDPNRERVELPIRGMSHDELRAWAANPSLIVGKIVEVHAMKFSSNGLLREPRYKSIRHDKLVSDHQ